MNGTRLAVAHRIFDAYKTEYEAVFGAITAPLADTARFPLTGKPTQAAFDGMTADDKLAVNRILANYGKALAAYTRKLVSREAPFDTWSGGVTTARSRLHSSTARSCSSRRAASTATAERTFRITGFHTWVFRKLARGYWPVTTVASRTCLGWSTAR